MLFGRPTYLGGVAHSERVAMELVKIFIITFHFTWGPQSIQMKMLSLVEVLCCVAYLYMQIIMMVVGAVVMDLMVNMNK